MEKGTLDRPEDTAGGSRSVDWKLSVTSDSAMRFRRRLAHTGSKASLMMASFTS